MHPISHSYAQLHSINSSGVFALEIATRRTLQVPKYALIQPEKQSVECWTLNSRGFDYVVEERQGYRALTLDEKKYVKMADKSLEDKTS